MHESSMSRVLKNLLARLKQGDAKARDELIGHAYERLVILARRMLGRYSRLRAWEQTDDVAQNAMLRLRRALESEQPDSVREFMGLASLQIRRELLDMSRHHFGREGSPATDELSERRKPRAPQLFSQQANLDNESHNPGANEPGSDTDDPSGLDMWRAFHEAVQNLPDNERESVEMLWYQELTQEEAAEILGVDKSTVKRRWRSARLLLHKALDGWLPMAGES